MKATSNRGCVCGDLSQKPASPVNLDVNVVDAPFRLVRHFNHKPKLVGGCYHRDCYLETVVN
jgi:hypothetical protein